jgi:hypothetical protein
VTKGIGRDANPIDGDHVTIVVEVSDGKIASVATHSIDTAAVTYEFGRVMPVHFRRDEETDPPGGDTFDGCEAARRAALAVGRLARGKTVDEAMAINVRDVILSMDQYVAPENERCVLTALGALRSALIDVHVAQLAEATVDVHRLRVK